ncbi:FtsW Bacterial cell division membrane protein [Burkholderiales bacterium]
MNSIERRKAQTGWRAVTFWLKQRFDRLDQPLFWTMVGIFVVSLFAVYSASHDDPERFMGHVRNLLLSMTLMVVLAQVPAMQFQKAAVPLYLLGVVLLLAVEFVGETSKGATRWLNIGITRIQPSELMKIAMPLMLASLVHQREGLKGWRDWILPVLLLVVPVALILKQPDLGTAILVGASGFFVLYLSGIAWRLLLVAAVVVVGGIILLVALGDTACGPGVDWPGLREYQRQRVCTLLDPMRDPLGKGFHIIQSVIAVGSGGIFGKGWMQGTQTQLEFIPERATDFVFSGFAEEFGFLGAILLLALYLGVVLRGLWISLGAPTLFGRLLAASISLIIFTYAFVNLGMVTGILPVVGVPLPFLSYGGTAMVTLGVGMGLLFSVARDRSRVTQGFTLHG